MNLRMEFDPGVGPTFCFILRKINIFNFEHETSVDGDLEEVELLVRQVKDIDDRKPPLTSRAC